MFRSTPPLLLLLLAGCASAGGGAAAPALEATTFAPALEVELATMAATPGGVRYRDVEAGIGAEARRGDEVTVHYQGWLPDGRRFESTAGGAPVTFRLGGRQVIRGWEEGIVGMRAGGRRRLVVPPRLGYGARAVGPVPANSVLVFEIDLVTVR
jgi:FKBP-type peptidyl-prolyl cis-trans isomerase